MKLYKKIYDSNVTLTGVDYKKATLTDLKQALAEYGMVAVPIEPTESMLDIWPFNTEELPSDSLSKRDLRDIYKEMLAAAQEEPQ